MTTNLLKNIDTHVSNKIKDLEEILKEVHMRNIQLDIDLSTSRNVHNEHVLMIKGLKHKVEHLRLNIEQYKKLSDRQNNTIKELVKKCKAKPVEAVELIDMTNILTDKQFIIHLCMTILTIIVSVYLFKLP